MDTLLGIAIGIGLSAACGFRVFVPLLVMNLMAQSGQLHLSSGFDWIGSHYATVAFATATTLEVLGYYIPWVDHVLDIAATPAAVIAGTVATASMADIVSVSEMDPGVDCRRGHSGIDSGSHLCASCEIVTVNGRCREPRNLHLGIGRIDHHRPACHPCPGSLPRAHRISLYFRYCQSRSVHTEENETDIGVNMVIVVCIGTAF